MPTESDSVINAGSLSTSFFWLQASNQINDSCFFRSYCSCSDQELHPIQIYAVIRRQEPGLRNQTYVFGRVNIGLGTRLVL